MKEKACDITLSASASVAHVVVYNSMAVIIGLHEWSTCRRQCTKDDCRHGAV